MTFPRHPAFRAFSFIAQTIGFVLFMAAVCSPIILLAIASEPAPSVFIAYGE